MGDAGSHLGPHPIPHVPTPTTAPIAIPPAPPCTPTLPLPCPLSRPAVLPQTDRFYLLNPIFNLKGIFTERLEILCKSKQLTFYFVAAAASTGFAKDVIYPELTCPPPTSVTLSDYSLTVTLSGAEARDNVGIASLEYIPQLVDDSAKYEVPDRLILSRSSIGRNYAVLVKARDVGGNEAECRYSVAIKGSDALDFHERTSK